MCWVKKYDEENVIKRHNRQSIAYKIKENIFNDIYNSNVVYRKNKLSNFNNSIYI